MSRSLVRLYASVQTIRYTQPEEEGGAITEEELTVGFPFTTFESTVTFLEIPEDSPFRGTTESSFPLTNVREHVRVVVRVAEDGSTSEQETTVQSHERAIGGSSGWGGSKSAILFTGRTIGKSKAQISFRFPGFVTAREISDILGTLIPASKISSTPDATQIRPVFRIKGGRTFPIMSAQQAEGDDEATPGLPALPPAP